MTLQVVDSTLTTTYSQDLLPTDPLYLPLRFVKNGTVNSELVVKLFLTNDSLVDSYGSVVLTPVPLTKIGVASIGGWQLRIMSGIDIISTPTEAQWDEITPGDPMLYNDPVHDTGGGVFVFPNDNSYYFPFFMKLTIPNGTPVQISRSVSLKIDSVVVP